MFFYIRSFTSWNKNDPESKIQSSMRFISSFNLVSTMARVQWKNLAMTAEEGFVYYVIGFVDSIL